MIALLAPLRTDEPRLSAALELLVRRDWKENNVRELRNTVELAYRALTLHHLAGGRFREGTPDEVLNSRVLTELYGAPVFVLRAGDRLVVVGAPDAEASHHHHEEQH